MRLFSYKNRPFHLGSYPLELLPRVEESLSDDVLAEVPAFEKVEYHSDKKSDIVNAMARYAAMLDAIRDGLIKKEIAEIPHCPEERSKHLKSFGYYHDASQAGVCDMSPSMWLNQPYENPGLDDLADELRNKQTTTLAAGIDVVMAELRESMQAPATTCVNHAHAIVYLYEYPRDPRPDEPGAEWISNAQAQRASVRAAETGAVISNYIRLLGYPARAHTGSTSDVDLNKLAVAAGLAEVVDSENGKQISNPYLGTQFGIVAITTTLVLAADKPLSCQDLSTKFRSHGPAWWAGYSLKGKGFAKTARNSKLYEKRRFVDGLYPFENSKRVENPTTYIDEPRVPRVPKRTDMFSRALFGDMGKHVQDATRNGNYVRKSAASFGPRRPLAAFVLLQDGQAAESIAEDAKNSVNNAEAIKAALYFLGADAVGISRCPEWVYYSHNTLGEAIDPYHNNAISVIIDQGHETMEGASGDDWIACSQSMRAYLRFSLLGGIIGDQIRNLGYDARVHTVMDGEVLQPPLLLLSGLGEVSRIGEVILNPYLGPRLKSGVITTNMPLTHDKPIDFGLQNFCKSCNKCARECPSGAITAGPKKMFNGYETYKSDSQKCTQYRITNLGGAMCGRCMKTCPWNLEGLFAEAPFRWAASNIPKAAKMLASLDDTLGKGQINSTKKWWWDIGMVNDGPYAPPQEPVNQRAIQPEIRLKHKDQTLAVYPASLAPPPYPYPFPMDREAGIAAHNELLSVKQHKLKVEQGLIAKVQQEAAPPKSKSPVLRLALTKVESLSEEVKLYEFESANGEPLPAFEAGAHLDVVVAPEFLRQFSLMGDPADSSKYQIAVLDEKSGRGGSSLLHRIFTKGRMVFVSPPINHFPLAENADHTILMAGGIGATPLIAMAHRLHKLGKSFKFHYSSNRQSVAAFEATLQSVPWSDNVIFHYSNDPNEVSEGRANLEKILTKPDSASHVYTCGPDAYMQSVLDAAQNQGWAEPNVHREYFSVPEAPEYENHSFKVQINSTGETLTVPEDESLAEVLIEKGFPINLKCSDGLCGVCKCGVISGDVEHRDYVLSKSQHQDTLISCQSRAAEPGGLIVLDL